MNVDWPRWIKASIIKHFLPYFGDRNLLVDGERRLGTQPNDRYELRFDGPDVSIKTRNEYRLGIMVNLLIVSSSNENDIYKLDRMKGTGLSPFTTSIAVFKYGNNVNDDQSQIGCLTLKSDLNLRDFGYKNDTIYHVAIDAYYLFEPTEQTAIYQEALTFDVITVLEASS
jgi:hypothetical protein